MKYTQIRPCDNCPFRTDVEPYIHPERVDEIEQDLDRGTFACHKTVNYDDGLDGEGIDRSQQHCAGALILLEKIERPSQMMRICERLGMYDARKLDMDSPVYETFEDMRDACEQADMPKKRKRKVKR